MKKYLQLFIVTYCLLTTSGAISQSLQISDISGSILTNGTVLHISGDTTTGNLIIQYLHVKNISQNTVTVKSKKIETNLIDGTSVTMCFAGTCFMSTTFISSTSSIIAPNDIDSTFSGDYKPRGILGESIVTFVFFDVNNPNDSAWVEVHFDGVAVGIQNSAPSLSQVSNPFPNPAVNEAKIMYSFPENSINAKFILNDLLGSKILEENINKPQGTYIINTSYLKDGIYFYSLYNNEKIIQTRKLIVKH